MSVNGDGGSYLSWIKSQYKQEEPENLEDIASWKEDYEASNVSSQSAPTLTANAQGNTPEDEEEVPSLELNNPRHFGTDAPSPRPVKVDNYYVDGELEDEPEMSFYIPSGVAALQLSTLSATAFDDVEGGDQEDGDDGGGNRGPESIVHNDGTVMQDLDVEDEGQHETHHKNSHTVLHNHDHNAEDPIETLIFSDASGSDSESDTVAENVEEKSPEQWLQALAEMRLLNPRYRTITDIELLRNMPGGLPVQGRGNCQANESRSPPRNGEDGFTGDSVARSTADEVTRWFEDVQEFEAFDNDES